MVLADSEDIEPNLVGVFDFLDEVAQALRCAERPAAVRVRGGEAIDSDLHLRPPVQCAIRHCYAVTVLLTGRRRSARSR